MARKNQKHRHDERYRRAVARQLLMLDRGWYFRQPDPLTGMPPMGRATPVPVEEFLRSGDTVDSCDWRSWARGGAR